MSPGTYWVWAGGGNGYSMARQIDGSVWSWGIGSSGQLGTGVTGAQGLTRVSTLGWPVIAAGTNHVVALDANGSMNAWGQNWYGQFGDARTTSSLVPVMGDFQAFAATSTVTVPDG